MWNCRGCGRCGYNAFRCGENDNDVQCQPATHNSFSSKTHYARRQRHSALFQRCRPSCTQQWTEFCNILLFLRSHSPGNLMHAIFWIAVLSIYAYQLVLQQFGMAQIFCNQHALQVLIKQQQEKAVQLTQTGGLAGKQRGTLVLSRLAPQQKLAAARAARPAGSPAACLSLALPLAGWRQWHRILGVSAVLWLPLWGCLQTGTLWCTEFSWSCVYHGVCRSMKMQMMCGFVAINANYFPQQAVMLAMAKVHTECRHALLSPGAWEARLFCSLLFQVGNSAHVLTASFLLRFSPNLQHRWWSYSILLGWVG